MHVARTIGCATPSAQGWSRRGPRPMRCSPRWGMRRRWRWAATPGRAPGSSSAR